MSYRGPTCYTQVLHYVALTARLHYTTSSPISCPYSSPFLSSPLPTSAPTPPFLLFYPTTPIHPSLPPLPPPHPCHSFSLTLPYLIPIPPSSPFFLTSSPIPYPSSRSFSYTSFPPPTGEELYPVLELLLSSSLSLIRSLPLEGSLIRSLADTLISLSKCSKPRDQVS